MRVVIKVQRDDGQYIIRELNVTDEMDPNGVMMTKECMVVGGTFRSAYTQAQMLPDRAEADKRQAEADAL
jgi:hypothetical protein